jgi:N-formylglutamate amidohydrolase
VAHNRPYAGGYVLERHADLAAGIHAMQIEIDRSSYLDARMVQPGPGLDDVVAVLSALVRRLAASVAELAESGRDSILPLAAE